MKVWNDILNRFIRVFESAEERNSWRLYVNGGTSWEDYGYDESLGFWAY